MYRVADEESLHSTGFFGFMGGDAVLAVEWSENIPGALPPASIIVAMERGEEENIRKISIRKPYILIL